MKKIFVFLMLLATLSCSSQNDGAKNACQYVRELMNNQAANIVSVDVVMEDSVLTPYVYMYNDIASDSLLYAGMDMQKSWIMDKDWNDSLKQMPQYKGKWRKAYMIKVTMKSTQKLVHRVMMGDDGTTPQASSDDMQKLFNAFTK